jgi:hypothetical protein
MTSSSLTIFAVLRYYMKNSWDIVGGCREVCDRNARDVMDRCRDAQEMAPG